MEYFPNLIVIFNFCRKKEKEQRKNLLCNPVKMKQLQQMVSGTTSFNGLNV